MQTLAFRSIEPRFDSGENRHSFPCMGSLPEQESLALETVENVLAALRKLPDRDPAIAALIESVEDDRARLLALTMRARSSAGRAQRAHTPTKPTWPR